MFTVRAKVFMKVYDLNFNQRVNMTCHLRWWNHAYIVTNLIYKIFWIDNGFEKSLLTRSNPRKFYDTFMSHCFSLLSYLFSMDESMSDTGHDSDKCDKKITHSLWRSMQSRLYKQRRDSEFDVRGRSLDLVGSRRISSRRFSKWRNKLEHYWASLRWRGRHEVRRWSSM